MSLTLNVLSFKNKPIDGINPVSISNDGGSIGRSDDNTLVLPDAEKFVSRHHASICFENNGYYLSDTSLSGIYIDDREAPLNNATERLDNGMRLRIGEYEIAVAIAYKPIVNDFPFVPEPVTLEPKVFLQADASSLEWNDARSNSLLTDSFPSHEELVQADTNRQPADFESRLPGNQSPLFDSYIAPSIIQPPSLSATEEIPDNLSFDDFFATTDVEKSYSPQNQVVNKATLPDDFEDFFGAAISDMVAGLEQAPLITDAPKETHAELSESVGAFARDGSLTCEQALHSTPIEPTVSQLIGDPLQDHNHASSDLDDCFVSNKAAIEPAHSAALPSNVNKPAGTALETDIRPKEDNINSVPVVDQTGERKSNTDSLLFNAFLQGATIECNETRLEQQTETLHRIGQMFRKLIDGTVAVLRSRAEFKSLCRVNMTVIRATNNNPLKFTVSTDDVLLQLLENKTDGFLNPITAIEEAFNDIMHHQLAMQAGIQASLTDLLKTFDPKIIEKQFEQGLVLQKKSKCWDKYAEVYPTVVEEAVENFFGEAFVKAYEQQMRLLISKRSNMSSTR
jgi:predicted component of type VI protein secretion system